MKKSIRKHEHCLKFNSKKEKSIPKEKTEENIKTIKSARQNITFY